MQPIGLRLEFKLGLLFYHHVLLGGGPVQDCQHFRRGGRTVAGLVQLSCLVILLIGLIPEVVRVVVLDQLQHLLLIEEARLAVDYLVYEGPLKGQVLVIYVGRGVLILDGNN